MLKRKLPVRNKSVARLRKCIKKKDQKKQARIANFSKMVRELLVKKLESCDELLDAQDMKQLFKVGDGTLRNWRECGLIVGSEVGRGYVYHKAMVYLLLINGLPKG
jgi:adenosyl cobinamide kinase/adenosyl cobinamide phosphate guanylyltransferase